MFALEYNVASNSENNPIDTHDGSFEVTVPLNGTLLTSQDNTDQLNSFVTVNKPVYHYIALNNNDKKFLKNNASEVTTYWFIDCQLVGSSNNYSLNQTYRSSKEYHVAAVLIASLDPLPLTTTPPKSTPEETTEEPTILKHNITADNEGVTVDNVREEFTTNKSSKTRSKRGVKNKLLCSDNFPRNIPENYAYGIFKTTVYVKEPINSINITGINRLQGLDQLDLEVKFKGSPPFVYCIMYKPGKYNMTGNETCETVNITTVSNSFPLVHYFSDYGLHTIVVVIKNDISKAVSAATVQVYESLINGTLMISQDNKHRLNSFVAVNKSVKHYINLNDNDKEFLKNNATHVTTFWFIDCQLVGSTDDLSLNQTYNDTMGEHKVEAVLIANLNHDLTAPKSNLLKCDNTLPFGDHYAFRRYETVVNVREPINSIKITGHEEWLRHEDLLNLEVEYTGSPPFDYCVIFKSGQYNVTGNETCTEKHKTIANSFSLVHYFLEGEHHTAIVVIENDLMKNVSGVTINIYKASVDLQLSVIAVPVVFCLIAVILVVLGIAYYQHKSRHTVEVADFDFGQNHSEFKTLRQRIRDSLANIFHFSNHHDIERLIPNSDDVNYMP